MNETEIIQGARDLLSDPKRWHKGSYTNDEETAFCVRGALGRVNGNARMTPLDPWNTVGEHLPEEFRKLRGRDGLSVFNDDPATTHADILNLLDKTLADLGAL